MRRVINLFKPSAPHAIYTLVRELTSLDSEWAEDRLGIWNSENESTSFYASICFDQKKRGVQDIFIACHDNLKGLGGTINAVFPKTKQQLYIVHQIRNSTKFVQYWSRDAPQRYTKKFCYDIILKSPPNYTKLTNSPNYRLLLTGNKYKKSSLLLTALAFPYKFYKVYKR
jgi:hypothetical protein